MHTARNALAITSLLFLLLGCGATSAPASDAFEAHTTGETHTTGGSVAPVPVAPRKSRGKDETAADAGSKPPVPPPATQNVGQQAPLDVTH